MKPTGHTANIASTSKTGLLATLRGRLHIGGSGAPKTSQGTGAPARRLLLPVLATTLGALAFTATPALAALETPEKEEVTAVTATTAHVSGVLNPKATGGVEGGFYGFQYGVSAPAVCGAEKLVPEPFPGAGIAAGLPEEGESFELTGLQPHAKYTFCLLELNTAQTEQIEGVPVSFETKPATPAVESESASSINAGGAHLEGVVNPNNETTECKFQYGTDPSLATSTTALCEPPTFAAAYGGQGVGLNVGGLEGKTTYYYRVVVSNPTGVNEGTIEHFTTATAPETPEGEKAEPITGTTATLHGILNPKAKGEAGSYEFTYERSETECSGPAGPHGELPFKTAPEPAGSSVGNTPEPVEAKITGLQPGATYTFCLLARNTVGETAAGSPVTFTTLATAPTITGEFASNIEATAATLNAQIEPDGATTTYHFEYGTTESYGQSTPETALTGTLTEPGTATATITGLQLGATYHYRAVAINAQSPAGAPGPDKTFVTSIPPSPAPTTCPNEQLRSEQPYGLDLPDCRAYEMVSPLDKNDNDVEAIDARASVSGDALTYVSPGSFAEPKGASLVGRYIGRRGSDGWSTQNITAPTLVFSGGNLSGAYAELLFTPELSKGILLGQYYPLIAGEEPGFFNVFVSNFSSTPITYEKASTVSAGEQYPNSAEGSPAPVGASTDLSHVVFQSDTDLTANATGGGYHAYEWVDGELSQVTVGPADEFNGGVAGSPGEFNHVADSDTWHAVSASGQRVFFTNGNGRGQLYVREVNEEKTVEVSKSQKTNGTGPGGTDPNGPQPAFYRDASAEGERVFFTSRAELTNDANTGPADNAANLYEYDLNKPEGERLTDLTVVGASAQNPEGAAVVGLATAGEEGSYVYFVANGVLTEAPNAEGAKATPGNCKKSAYEPLTGEHTCNLYVAHLNGNTWETKFIATLAGGDRNSSAEGDEIDWVGHENFGEDPEWNWGPGQHTVRVTPDGTTLAFESLRPLTGYDNEPAEPVDCTYTGSHSIPCRETYLYSATTGKLICASCNPSGARPVGESELIARNVGLVDPSTLYKSRNLSENGRRLFFQTEDALVPHDSNGKRNVYEWEAAGEGSCTQPDGCVYPISDVAGDSSSEFMDASANGENVFIATADQLVPSADGDTRVNVYDARVGGGFPVSVPPPSCNNGDSCKGPVSAQPGVFGVPSSATFSGPGNIAPVVTPPPAKTVTTKAVKCKKGFVKNKKGKCVKKTKTKRAKSKKKAKKSADTDRRAK